jgi:hypothetical protein
MSVFKIGINEEGNQANHQRQHQGILCPVKIAPTSRYWGPYSRIEESSSPGEFHPQALTDPDVNVSAHPALIIPSLFSATLPYLLAPPIIG